MNSFKKKYFISIFWGYYRYFHELANGENYHLHILKIALEEGYEIKIIARADVGIIKSDPNFDPRIEVIEYKNIFNYIANIIKYSLAGAVFYVNSYELQSFLVPFIARKTIFMAHTQPRRRNKFKQIIQNFVYKFFTVIRLNNEEEKEYLLSQGIAADKLFVAPLVVSRSIFKITDQQSDRSDLVYFGNVTEKKNIITILKAFEVVKEEYQDIRMHFIGNMFDQGVKDYIEDSRFKKDIILHGFLNSHDVARELNKRLIYLNSSLDEGQCVAVYDVALCGCVLCLPKIMSFVGVFRHGALFHDQYDYRQLAKNIVQYLGDRDLVERFRDRNIEMITGGYSNEVIAEKIKDLLKIFNK